MSISRAFKAGFQHKSLKTTYNNKIKYKCSPGIDRINRESFEKRLDQNMEVISRKVNNATYHFTPYKEKIISKGAHKLPRIISIPTIRDKVTIKVMHYVLATTYGVELNQKLTHTIIGEINQAIKEGYNYFFKLDIENFYPSLIHSILIKKLRKKIRKKEFLGLIEKAITNPTIHQTGGEEYSRNTKGVPQGLSISNILAQIYLIDVDEKYRGTDEYRFFRYVDDILVICKEDNYETIMESVISDLKALQLDLNKEKTDKGLIDKGFSYLGYSWYEGGWTVKSTKRLRESILKIFSEYKYSKKSWKLSRFIWRLNLRITGCIMEDNKYGWLFYYSQIDNKSLLFEVDWFISKLLIKYNVPCKHSLIKSYVKSYYEINFNLYNTSYIPNIELLTLQQKRTVLVDVLGESKDLSDEQVSSKFKNLVYRSIKELEHDIQRLS